MSAQLGKRKRRPGSKKRKRLKRPRKPKTAYNFYQLTVRQSVCQEVWDLIGRSVDRVLHNEHVARIIGRRWRAMPEDQRRVFQQMADQDKYRYKQEKDHYDNMLRAYLKTDEFQAEGSRDNFQAEGSRGKSPRPSSPEGFQNPVAFERAPHQQANPIIDPSRSNKGATQLHQLATSNFQHLKNGITKDIRPGVPNVRGPRHNLGTSQHVFNPHGTAAIVGLVGPKPAGFNGALISTKTQPPMGSVHVGGVTQATRCQGNRNVGISVRPTGKIQVPKNVHGSQMEQKGLPAGAIHEHGQRSLRNKPVPCFIPPTAQRLQKDSSDFKGRMKPVLYAQAHADVKREGTLKPEGVGVKFPVADNGAAVIMPGGVQQRNDSTNSLTRSGSGTSLFMLPNMGSFPRVPSYPMLSTLDF